MTEDLRCPECGEATDEPDTPCPYCRERNTLENMRKEMDETAAEEEFY